MFNQSKTNVSLTDPRGRRASRHVVLAGLTPRQSFDLIRRAYREHLRRLRRPGATKPAQTPSPAAEVT